METNNFATFLQLRSNKITRVLIYAFLEWSLISLLLLNSLFSLLIHKFAIFFGLKPPCIFCSRFDHDFQQTQKEDIICEKHAVQISRIGYCSKHRKLLESPSLCLDCVCDSGYVQDDEILKLSSSLDRDIDGLVGSLDFNVKSGFGMLDDDEKEEDEKESLLKNEEELGEEEFDNNGSRIVSYCRGDSDIIVLPLPKNEEKEEEDDDDDEKEENEKIVVSDGNMKLCLDMLPQHLEFYIDHDDHRLIPVDLINSKEVILCDEEDSKEFELLLEGDELICGVKFISKENLPSIQEEEEEEEEENEENVGISHPYEDESMIKEMNLATLQEQEEEKMDNLHHNRGEPEIVERNFASFVEEMEEKMEISQAHQEENGIGERSLSNFEKLEENVEISQETHQVETKNDETSLPTLQEEDEEEKMVISQPHIEENEVEVEGRSLATLHDQDEEENEKMKISQSHVEESRIEENSLASSLSDAKQNEEGEISEQTLKIDLSLSQSELEQGRIPETPALVEESVDLSLRSELECRDVTSSSIEKLNSELQLERKTLRALYKELEEERSASAVSANQTMAMINRLQEEKSTMQMEALQYQRMLEEQSEYDQEALQMMNELVVKREREKQDLEKELEVFRKKVLDYEERERARVLSRRREGRNSSASCSYGEESDGLSIDLNHEAKDHEETSGGIQEDTPIEAILGLQESLSGFEEERQAILEQLKALEEKLFTLVEEEEEHVENMKPFEQFYEENARDFDQLETRLNGSMQKRLLPLFDATELMESPEEELEGREEGFDYLESNKSPIMKFELEKKRLALEEEVDLVYERLQALEADREFLKHCIGSLRKGDKGLDLLQEILQHLRDLKSAELQAMKNMDHCASV